MDLADAVKRYLEAAGGFDQPLHLSKIGLTKPDIEQIFSTWDEDYQISRFMLLSRAPDEELEDFPADLRTFRINDYEYTHVTLREGIKEFISSA